MGEGNLHPWHPPLEYLSEYTSWGNSKIPPVDWIRMDAGHKAKKNPSDNADLGFQAYHDAYKEKTSLMVHLVTISLLTFGQCGANKNWHNHLLFGSCFHVDTSYIGKHQLISIFQLIAHLWTQEQLSRLFSSKNTTSNDNVQLTSRVVCSAAKTQHQIIMYSWLAEWFVQQQKHNIKW